MQYKVSFALSMFGSFFVTLIEVAGIWALFECFGALPNWSLAEVCVFYGVVNMAFALAEVVSTGFASFGPFFVKTGEFDRLLLRPRSAALQLLGIELSLRCVGRLAQGLVVLIWGLANVEQSVGVTTILLIVFALAGGMCLFIGLFVFQAVLSFWTVESLEVMNVLTYGGVESAQFPLRIYHPLFRRFFTFVVPVGNAVRVPGVDAVRGGRLSWPGARHVPICRHSSLHVHGELSMRFDVGVGVGVGVGGGGVRVGGRWVCRLGMFCVVLAMSSPATAADFDEWLGGLRQDALAAGIREATVDAALTGLTPDERVLGFDRRQPEFVQSQGDYLKARVGPRVDAGRERLRQHRAPLARVGDAYGVEPRYLVAIWGLETSFGRHQGTYSIVRSLATLAHDPRRSAFFRRQLMSALVILDEGHVDPDAFVGGWAGAMGQSQFMPSTFLNYAVDDDKDGRKDIWTSKRDVWASIANYLQRHNWVPGLHWGESVDLPAGFEFAAVKAESVEPGCRALRYHSRQLPASAWRQRGFAVSEFESDVGLTLIEPVAQADNFLVSANFRAILAYNCANKYALSVGLLADSLR